MKCPECEASGLKSDVIRIFFGWSSHLNRTDHWDNLGQHHHHDYNYNIDIFRCTQGHEFIQKTGHKCMVAGCTWKTDVVSYLKQADFTL